MSKSFVQVVPSTLQHAESIGQRLCEEDKVEAFLQTGKNPAFAPIDSFNDTEANNGICFTVMVHGVPELIVGACTHGLLSDTGTIWMLQTAVPKQRKYRALFGLYSHKTLQRIEEYIPCRFLQNWTHFRNVSALQWLKWLGFTIDKRNGEWFHFFKEIHQ